MQHTGSFSGMLRFCKEKDLSDVFLFRFIYLFFFFLSPIM